MRVTLPMVEDAKRERSEHLAAQLRALAEPNRLRIIELLHDSERCVCEIEDALGLSQSLVSNHLRVLRQADIVVARRDAVDARWVYYRLNADVVNGLLGQLNTLLALGDYAPSTAYCTTDGVPLQAGEKID